MDETMVVKPKKTKEHERQYPLEHAMKTNKFIPPVELTTKNKLIKIGVVASFDSKPNISNNKSHEPEQMENNNRTLKELAMPDFFPSSKTVTIRKEICGIRQHSRETLHEYWERFNKLCATCPHHQISE
ncbi:hypothetical protein CR513_23451, partial [Mucuna pruriens]